MRLNGERYINMVIYISGPITGEKDYMERFMNAETRINKVTYGDVIINPAYILSALPDGTSHDIYMSVAMKLLELADTIALLDGWENSEGCKEEVRYAIKQDYLIIEVPNKGRISQHLGKDYEVLCK